MKNANFHILLLSLLPGVGPSCYWSCVERFGSAEAALLSPPDQLPKLPPAAEKMLREFQLKRDTSSLAHRGREVLETIEQQNACLLSHLDPQYPGLLSQIHQAPPVLFAKGDTALLSLPQIAIVGTRHPTQTGMNNTRDFARYLAEGGFTITSGLAMGIDGAAHEAALEAKGKTIAVMATGIDQIYPRRHRRIADAILNNEGSLITEFFPGTEPRAANFPRRNRIISGLSLAVLVVEAAIKSGSLITARCALEQNREVFALPSSIHNPQAKGCHALIKEGAQLVERGRDIVQNLTGMMGHFCDQQVVVQKEAKDTLSKNFEETSEPPLNEAEQKVMRSIGYDIITIEQIIERTGLNSSEVTASLLTLEMRGAIKHSDWGYEAIQDTKRAEAP